MKVHFIAIGGSVMHNLAIALKQKGYAVSGSDDDIYEPAKSNLLKYGLLPEYMGWNEERISEDLDAVVLGMHAKSENPELNRAKQLGIKIYSYPEFIFEQSKNKKRVVIGGSHGKTTITAMVLHILKRKNLDFDYMVGASLEGFDVSVRLSESAPVIILEGDEYPDSALNKLPKFLIYQPDIALLSGIAWDHINVFPTFENYVLQFERFVDSIVKGGTLIFNSEDEIVRKIVAAANDTTNKIPYSIPEFSIVNHTTFLIRNGNKIALKIFGRHNLQNIMGATAICKNLGVEESDCLESLKDFTGASRRLELLAASDTAAVYKDFAHSPSKLSASIAAVKEQFPERKLVACLELHTYSSVDVNFLKEYRGSMSDADIKIIFYETHTSELKNTAMLDPGVIRFSFNDDKIIVFTEIRKLREFFLSQPWENATLLMMSSGNFSGLDLKDLSTFVITHT
ncbi:MAG: peptidoglycan synthetase [Chitinophagales bacterium]|nr:peptidoglycan synthetase [Chitinophagales bacterium]